MGHAVIALTTAYFGSSAPVKRLKVVATAATNKDSALLPTFGHLCWIVVPATGRLQIKKLAARNAASARKIAASILNRKIFGRNGFGSRGGCGVGCLGSVMLLFG